MPLVRIDVPEGKSREERRAIADAIYDALREHLEVPDHDRFQVISEHRAEDLLIDPTYLGIARSQAAVVIQITLSEGRSVDMKKAFYKAVVEGLKTSAGLRPEDVMINLVEVRKENWSFSNGIAQYT
jgi:4-oxalocrotonate tautomerase